MIDPNEFSVLNKNSDQYFAQQKAKAAATPKKGPGGIKGFLSSLISEAGGTGGALGGAALGTALLPGIGTVLGAGLGGFLGGTGGRIVENEVRDHRVGLGDALKEGAFSGIAGAGPVKLLKGAAGALKGGVTGTGIAEGASKAVSKPILKKLSRDKGGKISQNLTTQGQQAQGRVTGVSAGTKVAGRELVPQDTERMLGTIKQEGIKTGNANNTLRDITDKQKIYGKQISDHFKNNNHSLRPEDTRVVSSNFLTGLKTTDPGVLSQAKILADDLEKNVKSTKDLWEFRKKLDDRIPDTKQGTTLAVSNKIEAVKSMRQYIAKELGDVPAMKNYHDLSEIKPFISAEARRLNNPGGGFVGRLLSSGPVQKLENVTGQATEKLGSAGVVKDSGSTPGVKNFASRILASKAFTPPSGDQTQDDSSQLPGTSADLLGNNTGSPNTEQTDTSPFAPDNIQSSVQKILAQGGTMKDVSEFLSNAKVLNDINTSGGSSSTYGKPSAQQHGLAKTGVSSLQQLSQMIQEDPSIIEKNATPGQGLPLVGSLVSSASGASGYHALADSILSSLIHLQTGATATKEEVTSARGQLPQPGDSPEVRQQKIQTLMENFSPFLGGTESSGMDLQDVLTNSGIK